MFRRALVCVVLLSCAGAAVWGGEAPDLTAADLDAAVRTIAGTARSMGIDVVDHIINRVFFGLVVSG